MQLAEIDTLAIAQVAASDVTTRDLAGNSRGIAFRAVKYYTHIGRPLPNAAGWYDFVNVHYFAFEEMIFDPQDFGESADLELRQGHDPASRATLFLADPGNTGFPFAVYAGSNSKNHTVFAMVPRSGGVWLAYTCRAGRAVTQGRSDLDFQGVRPVLQSASAAICRGHRAK